MPTTTLSPQFVAKVDQMAQRLGTQPDYLLQVMDFETGGTFDPAIRNKAGSGATGLIQFMPETARRLGTTTEKLARMTPEQQLDYVERYFAPYTGKLTSLQDTYMAVLYPKAIGKSAQQPLFAKGSQAYAQNAGLDTARKGVVTVGDAVRAVGRFAGRMLSPASAEAASPYATMEELERVLGQAPQAPPTAAPVYATMEELAQALGATPQAQHAPPEATPATPPPASEVDDQGLGPPGTAAAQGLTPEMSASTQDAVAARQAAQAQMSPFRRILERGIRAAGADLLGLVTLIGQAAQAGDPMRGQAMEDIGATTAVTPQRLQQITGAVPPPPGQGAGEQWAERVVREGVNTAVMLPLLPARGLSFGQRVAAEALPTIGSATGAVVAQRAAPGSALAEVGGQLVGGLSGMAATSGLARLGDVVPTPASTQRDMAAQIPQAQLGQVEQNVAALRDVQQLAPDFRPTAAEVTGTPHLLQQQQQLAGQVNPRTAEDIAPATRLQQTTQRNLQATGAAVEHTMGDPASTGAIRSALESRRTQLEAAADARVTAAEQDMTQRVKRIQAQTAQTTERITDRLEQARAQGRAVAERLVHREVPQDTLRSTVGRTIREAVNDAFRSFQGMTGRLARGIDPENDVQTPARDIYTYTEAALQRAREQVEQRDIPLVLRDTQDAIQARAVAAQKAAQADAEAMTVATPLDLGPPLRIITGGKGRTQPDKTLELQQFVRRQGGINPTGDPLQGEWDAFRTRQAGTSGLINRRSGLSPQRMAERLESAGFLEDASIDDMRYLLSDSLTGRPVYSRFASDPLGNLRDPFATPDDLRAAAATIDRDRLLETPLSFQDVARIRSRVLREMRETDNPRSRRILQEYEGLLSAQMQDMAEQSGRPEVFQRYRAMADFYRANIERFTTGPGERILARQRNANGYKLGDSDVVSAFWHLNRHSPEDAARFHEMLGGATEAQQALRTYAENSLYLAAVDDTGRLHPDKVRQWQQKYQGVLAHFPTLRDEFTAVADLGDRIRHVEARGQRLLDLLAARERGVAKAATQRGAVRDDAQARLTGTVTPTTDRRVREVEQASQQLRQEQVAAAQLRSRLDKEVASTFLAQPLEQALAPLVTGSPRDVARLVELVGQLGDNEAAKRGLLRGIYDAWAGRQRGRHVLPGTDLTVPTATQITQFATTYAPVIEALFPGSTHVRNLQTLAKGVRMVETGLPQNLPRPPTTPRHTTPHRLGRLAQAGVAALRSPTVVGGGAGYYVMGGLPGILTGMVVAKGAETLANAYATRVARLAQEMLFDPEIAQTLVQLRRGPKAARIAETRLMAHWINLGLTAREDDSEDVERLPALVP